jgi:hypothetical protein
MEVGETYQLRDSSLRITILALDAEPRAITNSPMVSVRIHGVSGKTADYVMHQSQAEKSLGAKLST